MFILAGLWHGGTSLIASCCNSHSKLNVLYENQRLFRSFWQNGKEGWHDFVKLEQECKSSRELLGAKFVENQIFPYKAEWRWKRIQDLENDYRDNKYIIIYRDSRDYAISHHNNKSFTVQKIAERWNRFVETTLYFVRNNTRVKQENIMTVKFEEFIDNPEKECKRICKFLGVEYEPSMLNFKMLNPQYEKKYGNIIDKSRKEIYRNYSDQKFIAEITQETQDGLLELGYFL